MVTAAPASDPRLPYEHPPAPVNGAKGHARLLVLQGYFQEKRLVVRGAALASSQVKEGPPYIWPCSTRPGSSH